MKKKRQPQYLRAERVFDDAGRLQLGDLASEIRQCTDCRASVGLAPSSIPLIEHRKLIVVCTPCWLGHVLDDESPELRIMITNGQWDELADFFEPLGVSRTRLRELAQRDTARLLADEVRRRGGR